MLNLYRNSRGLKPREVGNDQVHVSKEYIQRLFGEAYGSLHLTSGTPYSFKWEYQLEKMWSKYNDMSTPQSVLYDAALASFTKGEESCLSMNSGGLRCSAAELESMRTHVKQMLGAFSYEKVLRDAKHGSGATFVRRRAFGPAPNKYCSATPSRYYNRRKRKFIIDVPYLSCTPLALKYWRALCPLTILSTTGDDNNVLLCKGNSLTTVPKNNKTDRTIAKEPCINMYLQLGVGSYLAKQLKKIGNCKHDQSRNQEFARLGSIDGSYATIDLERASDSLSFALVYALLPDDWLCYLDDIRSHYYYHDNTWHRYEKFCTMGNGFCFELQTIIFMAIALTASNCAIGDIVGRFSTYGDDIIVPTEHANATLDLLTRCGFTPNLDKTFIEGPFRESCGKHYHSGIDVTPFYVRKPIDSIERLCHFLNSLRKWAYYKEHDVCDDTVWPLWLDLYKRYPILRKLRGGRNIDRIDYLVTPGRPTGRLLAKVTRIVVCEQKLYYCSLSQGLETETRAISGIDRDRNIHDLYHYGIHPENDEYEVTHIMSNLDERQLHPTRYIFLAELQVG